MSQVRTPTGTDTLERTRYFPRQIVTPPDLMLDGEYLLHKLRRHHRLIHGWGIVLGLTVEKIPPKGTDDATKKAYEDFVEKHQMPDDVDPTCGNWVVVTPGYAISPRGDELYVPMSVFVNTMEEVNNALVVKPGVCSTHANPGSCNRTGETYYLVVEAAEFETRPVRAAGSRCGDDPDSFQFSRLRDSVRFQLIEKPNSAPDPVAQAPFGSDHCKLIGKTCNDRVVLSLLTIKNHAVQSMDTTGPNRSLWQHTGPGIPQALPLPQQPPVVVKPPPPAVIYPPPQPQKSKNWLVRLWNWFCALCTRFWKWLT